MITLAYPKAAIMKAAYGKRQQKIRNKERQNRDIDEFFILQTMLKKHGMNSILKKIFIKHDSYARYFSTSSQA